MVAETNRKRRKLERDRRATERPQPSRHISPTHKKFTALTCLKKFGGYLLLLQLKLCPHTSHLLCAKLSTRTPLIPFTNKPQNLIFDGNICLNSNNLPKTSSIPKFRHYLLVTSHKIWSTCSKTDEFHRLVSKESRFPPLIHLYGGNHQAHSEMVWALGAQ